MKLNVNLDILFTCMMLVIDLKLYMWGCPLINESIQRSISIDLYISASRSVSIYILGLSWNLLMYHIYTWIDISRSISMSREKGGSPGAVVKVTCLKSRRLRVRTPLWPFKFQINKIFIPQSLVKIQYCREPPWPRGSVLDLRPPVQPICAQRWPKTPRERYTV